MSTVAGGTETSPDLVDLITQKLAQADAICIVVGAAKDLHADHKTIADSMWIASELIGDAKKAVDELCETVIKPSKALK